MQEALLISIRNVSKSEYHEQQGKSNQIRQGLRECGSDNGNTSGLCRFSQLWSRTCKGRIHGMRSNRHGMVWLSHI